MVFFAEVFISNWRLPDQFEPFAELPNAFWKQRVNVCKNVYILNIASISHTSVFVQCFQCIICKLPIWSSKLTKSLMLSRFGQFQTSRGYKRKCDKTVIFKKFFPVFSNRENVFRVTPDSGGKKYLISSHSITLKTYNTHVQYTYTWDVRSS